jgi:hypothetical protein
MHQLSAAVSATSADEAVWRLVANPLPFDPTRVTTLEAVIAEARPLERGWSIYVADEDPRALSANSPVLLVFDMWDDVEDEASNTPRAATCVLLRPD